LSKHKYSTGVSVNKNHVRSTIMSEVIDEVLNSNYEDDESEEYINLISNGSDVRKARIFNEIINGQSLVIAQCIENGEDIKVDHLGIFKRKLHRKIFVECEDKVLSELNLKRSDIDNPEISKEVKEKSKVLAKEEYNKLQRKDKHIKNVINIDFRKIVKK
jgi:hypothetical protein